MISFTLIANAGIYMQYKDIRILLDGIQSEGNYPFSKTPPAVLAEMLSDADAGKYNDIEYLIFSHSHPDHCSPDIVAQYLRHNCIKRILLPNESGTRLKLLRQTIQDNSIPAWYMEMVHGAMRGYRLHRSITVSTLCTRHMPQIFEHDLCNCIFMQFEEKNVLFLTDCSCSEGELLKVFEPLTIDMVFVNPYFYHDAIGREILKEYINPLQTIIYHLPFAGDDQISLRMLARQDAKKYPQDHVMLFDQPFQSIQL